MMSTDRFKAQAARPGALPPPAGQGNAGTWFEADSADRTLRLVTWWYQCSEWLGPAEATIKLFVWASISTKTFGINKTKSWIVQEEFQGSTSHLWTLLCILSTYTSELPM